MRITELVKPEELSKFKRAIDKNTDDFGVEHLDVQDELQSYMEKYGFKQLGAGGFASVFKSPKYDFVLKVFGENPGFLKWIEFCKKHPENPYLPRFTGKPIRIHNTYYAIRMELLSHRGGVEQSRVADAFAALIDKADRLYSGVDPHEVFRSDYADILLTVLPGYLKDEHLKQAALAVRSLSKANGTPHWIDIGKDNIMFRKDQFVITDPLSS